MELAARHKTLREVAHFLAVSWNVVEKLLKENLRRRYRRYRLKDFRAGDRRDQRARGETKHVLPGLKVAVRISIEFSKCESVDRYGETVWSKTWLLGRSF